MLSQFEMDKCIVVVMKCNTKTTSRSQSLIKKRFGLHWKNYREKIESKFLGFLKENKSNLVKN
jgi:hypothetical protein